MFAEIIKKAHQEGHYYNFAIRALADDENYSVGDDCRESYDWDPDQDCSTYETTGETAGGTCGIEIVLDDYDDDDEIEASVAEAIKYAGMYGKYLVLIAGGRNVARDYSCDPHEARLTDAIVIAILDDAKSLAA